MLKPYSDHFCLIRKQQKQQKQSIANALDRDPSHRAAFDHAHQAQLQEEIKKEGESKNELQDT